VSASVHDALRALVLARLAERGSAANEDVNAMAREAITMSEQIKAIRPELTPKDLPESFWQLLERKRRG
jgi:hypothetical protein